jgi:DNA-binding MarR family transcriptional regulator
MTGKACKTKNEIRVGGEIRMIHNLIGIHADRNMKRQKQNMTMMQSWVIGFLYHRQDMDIYQRDIEEEFDVSRATATNMLKLMEKREFIVRKPVDHDGRLKKIFLTPKAVAIHKNAMEDMVAVEKMLVQGMTSDEVMQLKRLLKIMHENVARDNEKKE